MFPRTLYRSLCKLTKSCPSFGKQSVSSRYMSCTLRSELCCHLTLLGHSGGGFWRKSHFLGVVIERFSFVEVSEDLSIQDLSFIMSAHMSLHSIPWDLPSFSSVSACSVTWVISNSFVIPWTVAREAPLCMGFSRQEHWSGLPFPSPGDLPDLEIEPGSPALQANSLPTEPPGRPFPSIPSAYCKGFKPKGLSIRLVWELCHIKVIF